jgi:hypothetical protein
MYHLNNIHQIRQGNLHSTDFSGKKFRNIEGVIKSLKQHKQWYGRLPFFTVGDKTNASSSSITKEEFLRMKEEFPMNVNNSYYEQG